MSYPLILTKNYVNSKGVSTLSSGDATAQRAYDWDGSSYWESVGSDDVTVETFEHEFYEEASAVNRTFDTVIIRNHNLKQWKLQYWNGSAWTDTDAVYTNDTNSTTYASISEISNCSKVRLYMETTQSVDAEKQVGEFIVCNLTYTFSQYIDPSYSTDTQESVIRSRSVFGNLTKKILIPTQYRYEKERIRFSVGNLTDSDITSLRTIKENGVPFIFYPFPTLASDQVYYVDWTSPFTKRLAGQSYVSAAQQWIVNFTFEEV